MPGYRVIIVDDHPLFRAALKQALSGAFFSVRQTFCATVRRALTLRGAAGSTVRSMLIWDAEASDWWRSK